MNEQLRHPYLPPTILTAQDLMGRHWTVAEIQALAAAGTLLEDERFELIEGEVVPMSPKGCRHEAVKQALQQYWFPRCPPDVKLITETTLYVSKNQFLEPDFLFWPASVPLANVTPVATLLIVEVADSSLGYDLGRKAGIYARIGLRELWVIDAENLTAAVHVRPTSTGYAERRQMTARDLLAPAFAPGFGLRLADLDLA